MNRKNFLPVLIIVLAFSFLLGACSTSATPAAITATETSNLPSPVPALEATKPPTPEATTQAADQPIVLTDGLNRTVTLDKPAQRVVSMAPSNTEILFAVGAGSQVVGRDEFSDYPTDATKLPSIGGSFGEYNNEAIVDLKPDLVLASELNTAEQVQALEALGLKVYLLSNPTDLDGMYKNLEIVGELTGHQTDAAELVQSLKARVAAVEAKLQNVSEQPLVFYELDSTDPNAPYTAGSGTFIDTLMSMAKGRNLGDTLSGQYAQISLEELVVQNPDIILLGDYTWGGVTPEDVAKRAGWEKLSAVQNGKVYTFDDNLVSRPGPRLVDGLEALANQLHP